MKKHIFGFMLFGLIVVSFVFVYAFFNAPSLPPIEAVKPPVAQTETREEKPYYCNLRGNKISYEVQSSEFYFLEARFIAKVKLTWNGNGEPPRNVYMRTRVFEMDYPNDSGFLDWKTLNEPFANGNQTLVNFETNFTKVGGLGGKHNYYAVFDFSDKDVKDGLLMEKSKLVEATPVLTTFDETRKNTLKKNSSQ